MKSKISIPYSILCSASLVLWFSPEIMAQTPQDGTWTASNTNGDWSNSSRWQGGVVAGGVGAKAILANPTAGQRTITIGSGETVTLGELQSNAVPASSGTRSYTISGAGTLNFNNNGSASVITLDTVNNGTPLTIATHVTGNGNLLIHGNNSATQLNWNPLSITFAGDISVQGAGLHINTNDVLGSGAIRLGSRMVSSVEEHAFLAIEQRAGADPSMTVGNNIVLESSGSGFKYSNSGSAVLRTVNVNGVISESGGSRQMNYVTDTGAGNGLFVVSGNNTYTGNTVIGGPSTGGVVVRATNNGAFGAGVGAEVSFLTAKTAVELANDVTIADKTIKLNGLGYGNTGSLRSISGENTWDGEVELAAAGENRIQVDAGKLTVSGEISGANTLSKTGNGILELAAENTHTGPTLISAGTLLLSHDDAMTGSALAMAAGTALEITAGVHATVAELTLANSAELVFTPEALGGPLLTVTGDLILSSISDLYEVTILGNGLLANTTYHLLDVEGLTDATLASFHLNIDSAYTGSYLTWSAGQLRLEVIPEASTVWLSLLGGGALLAFARRKNVATA